jgi:hypothetical protein
MKEYGGIALGYIQLDKPLETKGIECGIGKHMNPQGH